MFQYRCDFPARTEMAGGGEFNEDLLSSPYTDCDDAASKADKDLRGVLAALLAASHEARFKPNNEDVEAKRKAITAMCNILSVLSRLAKVHDSLDALLQVSGNLPVCVVQLQRHQGFLGSGLREGGCSGRAAHNP